MSRFPLLRPARYLFHPAGLRQRGLRLREYQASGLGQRHPVASPREQLDPQVALHGLDALRQWWLADVKSLGCPAEVLLLRDGDETGQLPEGQVQRHGSILAFRLRPDCFDHGRPSVCPVPDETPRRFRS